MPLRLLKMTSPLAEDSLLLTRLSVTEQLGLPYRVEADVLGKDPSLVAKDLLTREACATVQTKFEGQEIERHFHGIVGEFHRIGPGPSRLMAYRLILVPSLSRLGL